MLALILAAALGQVAPSTNAPPDPPTEATGHPKVAPRPKDGPLRYYPEQAWRDRVEGSAIIHCTVTLDGKLKDCKILSETPAGAGFGEAALKMSSLFVMKPARQDVESWINIPIRFKLPN